MSRACRCDISNDMASEIFTNDMPASMMADPVKLLWRYTSTSMKSCTPRWSEIHKWRHFLGDLLAATEGRRLRQNEWCRQLTERFKQRGRTNHVLSTDAKRTELDMTELEELEKLFATLTTKEHVLMDVEPSETTSAHCSTLQS